MSQTHYLPSSLQLFINITNCVQFYIRNILQRYVHTALQRERGLVSVSNFVCVTKALLLVKREKVRCTEREKRKSEKEASQEDLYLWLRSRLSLYKYVHHPSILWILYCHPIPSPYTYPHVTRKKDGEKGAYMKFMFGVWHWYPHSIARRFFIRDIFFSSLQNTHTFHLQIFIVNLYKVFKWVKR